MGGDTVPPTNITNATAATATRRRTGTRRSDTAPRTIAVARTRAISVGGASTVNERSRSSSATSVVLLSSRFSRMVRRRDSARRVATPAAG